MTHRTVIAGDIDLYLKSAHPTEIEERNVRLKAFPYPFALELSYPELDFANRWCWEQFGAANGECVDRHSEYRSCMIEEPHQHEGRWLTYWHDKTGYNFGLNEWYFAQDGDRERFIQFVPALNWGENYPK